MRFVVLLILAPLLLAQTVHEEPSFRGLTASEWAKQLTETVMTSVTCRELWAGDEAALPVLLRLLWHPSDEVREEAVSCLRRQRPAIAGPLVVLLLDEARPEVRVAALQVLGHFGRSATASTARVVKRTRDAEPTVRRAAARTLSRVAPPPSVSARKALLTLFADPDRDIRREASLGVARLGRWAVPSLIKLIEAGAEAEKSHLAWSALGTLEPGSDLPVEWLRDRLPKADPPAAKRLFALLGRAGPESRAILVDLLRKTDDAGRRAEAAIALRAAGGDPVPFRADLIRGLLHPDILVRRRSADALRRPGDHQGESSAAWARELFGLAGEGGYWWLGLMRRGTPGPQVAPVFLAALRYGSARWRWKAAKGLSDLAPHPGNAVPALVAALSDSDERCRQWAARALGGHRESAATAEGALVEALTDRSTVVRVAAAVALRRVTGKAERSVETLRRLLASPHPDDRWQALRGLRKLRGDAATTVPAIRELLSDEDRIVRIAAKTALRSIEGEDR